MGMNIVFKIVVFSFMLNIAAGTLLNVLPDLTGEYTDTISPFVDNKAQENDDVVSAFQGNITTGGTAQDSETLIDRVLDKTIIGKVQKLLGTVGSFLFGFPNVIYNILLQFTPQQNTQDYLDFADSFKTMLVTVFSLGYGFAIFYLFTGKNISR